MKNNLIVHCETTFEKVLTNHEKLNNNSVIYLIDIFFKNKDLVNRIPNKKDDFIHFVDSSNELTTDYVNKILFEIKSTKIEYKVVVGIGGGTSLDFAKAISNLLSNPGIAEDYQGWDLVKNPGIYKIGIPTLSGTGAEASKTCVMINNKNGLKLGMNSVHTIYDELILDVNLTKTVPRSQYFYTGMDTFIHCIESLNGSHRHMMSDSYSYQALELSKQVFLGNDDMMSHENREKLMIASYFGGIAIGNSYVGIVHPLSAGLSVVLGIHHCEANCITMTAMEEFYKEEFLEFSEMLKLNDIKLKKGICRNLKDDQYEMLYNSSIIHEKPLYNALGKDFKNILSKKKIIELYKKM